MLKSVLYTNHEIDYNTCTAENILEEFNIKKEGTNEAEKDISLGIINIDDIPIKTILDEFENKFYHI